MEIQPLDFEKPIFELQRRLQDLKAHSDEHDVDLDPAVKTLEEKLQETRRQIYGNLTAWQRVQLARHVQRPFALDYIDRCFTSWVELHGDRRFADDKAMPSGLAMLGQQRCIVVTHQKGRNTKENVMRNFGCAHPEGYRKALRLMRLGEKFGIPVISLIDTPGAFPGIGSEERHISEAIAVNLREMMSLRVPIIAAVVGEGGSGGALGIGRSRVDLRKRLLLGDQSGSVFRHFVERSSPCRRSGGSAKANRTGSVEARSGGRNYP
jgi:acetyl-CoA carboxylase carboxyl transferase subunit alpha